NPRRMRRLRYTSATRGERGPTCRHRPFDEFRTRLRAGARRAAGPAGGRRGLVAEGRVAAPAGGGMNGRPVSLEEVVAGLRSEGRLTDAAAARADALLEQFEAVQPWYVRAMVGFGAWIASLFVIGGVAGLSVAVGGVTLLGLGLFAAAVALRRNSDNDFIVQASLAASLAGQAMFAWGIAD